MQVESRTQRRRVKMARSVRVRPSEFQVAHFDEVRVTLSASPTGIYFTTWRDTYFKGMRVFLTFPYSPSTDARFCEYVGEVVSVDTLENCRRGIGIRFLMPLRPTV